MLAGTTWLTVCDFLPPKTPEDVGQVTGGNMAAIGDGSIVYFIDTEPHAAGHRSYYGEVVDGRIAVVPAPYWTATAPYREVRDSQGGLWVPSWLKDGLCVYRLSGQFRDEACGDIGLPWLIDKSGNLWLKSPRSVPEWRVWRDGDVRATITIPSSSNHSTIAPGLFSDLPGSVWAWTQTGLYHLTAANPADPARYAVTEHYLVDGIDGPSEFVGYSKLGYMALNAGGSLWLVKLPEQE